MSEITFGWTIERNDDEIDLTIHALCEDASVWGVPTMEVLSCKDEAGNDVELTKAELKEAEEKCFRLLDERCGTSQD